MKSEAPVVVSFFQLNEITDKKGLADAGCLGYNEEISDARI